LHLRPTQAKILLRESLSIDPFIGLKCHLRSVVHHIGDTPFSGHYTTCAKRTIDGEKLDTSCTQDNEEQWVFFNDQVGTKKSISYVTADESNQRSCCMALYELVEAEAAILPQNQLHKQIESGHSYPIDDTSAAQAPMDEIFWENCDDRSQNNSSDRDEKELAWATKAPNRIVGASPPAKDLLLHSLSPADEEKKARHSEYMKSYMTLKRTNLVYREVERGRDRNARAKKRKNLAENARSMMDTSAFGVSGCGSGGGGCSIGTPSPPT
jgi:hypothetical protein